MASHLESALRALLRNDCTRVGIDCYGLNAATAIVQQNPYFVYGAAFALYRIRSGCLATGMFLGDPDRFGQVGRRRFALALLRFLHKFEAHRRFLGVGQRYHQRGGQQSQDAN